VEGAGAPAGEGDRIDASTGELLEAARQWAPAEVGLGFPLLLDPAQTSSPILSSTNARQRRLGVVHVRNLAAKGWCTVHAGGSVLRAGSLDLGADSALSRLAIDLRPPSVLPQDEPANGDCQCERGQ
jgi:hypothetical protein